MTDEGRDRILAAIWRGIERLADALERLSSERVAQAIAGEVPQKKESAAPEQPPLPGMPADDWTPPEIEAKKPREWGNSVKIYDWLVKRAGDDFKYSFSLADLALQKDEIDEITHKRVGVASYPRVMSTLVRAGAIKRDPNSRGCYSIQPPSDELREAIERVAKKRKEVAA